MIENIGGLLTDIYFAAVNFAGFISMGVDKSRARRKAWRISERTLFLLATAGGSIGSIIGMRFFHHKTKHWYFVYGLPAILAVQLVLAGVLLSESF